MAELFDLFRVMAGNVWIYGVTFIAVLSILVFVHEWGHYIVARLCGVKVEVFSIGFGKELYGFYDKNGTRWKISAIPLGGYVKMFGDTDPASAQHTDQVEDAGGQVRAMTDAERQEAFFNKSVLQRAAIVFAGPAINFIFAILIFAALFSFYGKPVVQPIVAAVEVGGAAETAGLQPGDRVVSIDGVEAQQFDDIRMRVTLALDTPMHFVVQRGEQKLDVTVTPQRKEVTDRFGFKHDRGYLGVIGPSNGLDVGSIRAVDGVNTIDKKELAGKLIAERLGSTFLVTMKQGDETETQLRITPTAELNPELADGVLSEDDVSGLILAALPNDTVVHLTPVQGLVEATSRTYEIVENTLYAIGQMFMGTRSATELGGVIRIGAVAGDMAGQGFIALLSFTALLSVNLGLINLFPIPMLDGGHLVFYAAEAVRGKPLSERVQDYAFRFGLVVLVTLMLFANLNDIIQIVF